MATCFDKQYLDRPCLLLLLWILGIFGFIFLLLGMMIDELTSASLIVGGAAEYSITCSSSTFDTRPGPLNVKYKDTEYTQALLQKQAGSVWLAFGILACLFAPFLLYGIITDYYAGIFDHKKPVDYWKGCCMLQTWGCTRIAAVFMLILELLQIIVYSAFEKCSTPAFFDEIFGDHSSLKSIGGPSFVMVVLSVLCLAFIFIFVFYYQYRISVELPTGRQKRSPVQFNQEAFIDPNPRPKKEPTPPTGEAAQSEYFAPRTDVTRVSIMSEGDKDAQIRIKSKPLKPSGPPPIPQPKPKVSPMPKTKDHYVALDD